MSWLNRDEAAALEARETDAYRIGSEEGWWIERFGRSALLSVKSRAEEERLLGQLEAWTEETGVALDRVYLRHLVRQPREQDTPILLRGEGNGSEVVREEGLRYGVDFSKGYSVGLFCDQRANRLRLRTLRPRRVLNTFAYTCAFGVAAAAVGATTVNIDLSKSSLRRGRENFSLNGFDAAAHRFLVDDVLAVLPRLAERDEKFDAIILDPPTFGRSSPRRSFRAERDFEELITLALACAAPGAALLLSTNCMSLNIAKLRSMGARVARGKAEFHSEPPQPDIPARHGAATVWMQLK